MLCQRRQKRHCFLRFLHCNVRLFTAVNFALDVFWLYGWIIAFTSNDVELCYHRITSTADNGWYEIVKSLYADNSANGKLIIYKRFVGMNWTYEITLYASMSQTHFLKYSLLSCGWRQFSHYCRNVNRLRLANHFCSLYASWSNRIE